MVAACGGVFLWTFSWTWICRGIIGSNASDADHDRSAGDFVVQHRRGDRTSDGRVAAVFWVETVARASARRSGASPDVVGDAAVCIGRNLRCGAVLFVCCAAPDMTTQDQEGGL